MFRPGGKISRGFSPLLTFYSESITGSGRQRGGKGRIMGALRKRKVGNMRGSGKLVRLCDFSLYNVCINAKAGNIYNIYSQSSKIYIYTRDW